MAGIPGYGTGNSTPSEPGGMSTGGKRVGSGSKGSPGDGHGGVLYDISALGMLVSQSALYATTTQ